MNDERSIFQKIIDGDAPAEKVYEDDRCIAILDLFPANPGHTLVISKNAEPDILNLPEDDVAHCFKVAKRLAGAIQNATECDGINLLQNNGEASGQMVFHFHLHIIPRFSGDGLDIPEPGEKVDNDYKDKWGDKIREQLETD